MYCPKHSKCNAPVCPENKASIKNGVWFPDEGTCNQSKDSWIKTQSKIKDQAKDLDTCYTYKMLSKNCKIGKAIKGIDPDKDLEIEEPKWLNKHPVKDEMSKEQKERLKERASIMRSRKTA